MTASSDDLHRLVDELPEERRAEALERLKDLVEGTPESISEDRWSGEGLLALAGTAEGPEDLASEHDRYLHGAS